LCDAWSAYKKGDPAAAAAWQKALDRSVAFVHISDFAREKLQCFDLPEKELKKLLDALVRRLANDVSRGVRRAARRTARHETHHEKAFRLLLSFPPKGHRRLGSSRYGYAVSVIPKMEAAVILYRDTDDPREIHRIEQDLAPGAPESSPAFLRSVLESRAPRGAAIAIIANAKSPEGRPLKEATLRRRDEEQRRDEGRRSKGPVKSMRKKPL
jgi:hypothetical protein